MFQLNSLFASLLYSLRGQTRQQSLQTEAGSYFALAIASGMDIPIIPGYDFHAHTTKVGGAGKINPTATTTSIKNPSKSKTTTNTNTAIATHFGSLPFGHSPSPENAGTATGPSHLALQGLRMTTESFALDSFENFLFSMARFREFTGKYPERITIVGYGMKANRFEELHAKAIRWPTKGFIRGDKRFNYVGIDDQGDVSMEYEGEVSLERMQFSLFSLLNEEFYWKKACFASNCSLDRRLVSLTLSLASLFSAENQGISSVRKRHVRMSWIAFGKSRDRISEIRNLLERIDFSPSRSHRVTSPFQAKRRERNPTRRYHPYFTSAPEIGE